LELTTAAGGPPTTGIFTFADSLNWQYDSEYMQPYTVQVQNTWGGGPNIFSVGDGEGYDGPEGPFSISWTATYSGDRVYAPFTVSGSADGPGCPSPNAVPSSPARRSAPRFPGPHIEVLSGGKHVSSSSTSGNAVSPSSTTLTAAPSSQLRGAKFAPLPPASQDGLSLRSHATTSQVTGCIAPAQAATPVLSLATGTFTSSQSLTVTDATSGAAIYYTTDGSAPTASSTLYSGPITVASTETVNAIATAAGYTNSAVASATYTFAVPAAQPTFSPQSGTYTSAQTITLADTTPGAAIYYTTDGSTPTASATLYSAPVMVSTTETINAIAIAAGYTASSTASATYTITPTFTVTASSSSLTLSPGQSVTTTISIAPQYGFTGATTFSCTGLPAGVTCSFSPASVTPSAGAAISTTLTISASSTASLPRSDQQPGPGGPSFATPILAFVLATFRWRRRRLFRQLLLLAFTTSALTLLSACGGGHSSSKPVSSTISVVATSGTIQQAVKINIIVQ
ncbi:MAG TPA: chitobiase/beta-hexosaminidase C-terminal domain-containing protein, partial [Acidobacteriaceae bacterium]|nr:chitobiase/beta-hexosaminidase C-terminal domain-containing protein [Acidobacteriaceae bacterium]